MINSSIHKQKEIKRERELGKSEKSNIRSDVSSVGACRPRIFFINRFLCFLEDEWQWNGERKRERRCHFKEKMSLEEAHHHRRPWIRAWRKKEMNEGRGREEHEILCSK